jgi:UDP-2,4-diacetamido-2,4,6-trideoxy-beta-L-altropyranose hydrolase
MEAKQSLLIRADANAEMGTGHLMRCLALAQAWQDRGGQAVFVTACDSDGLLERLRKEGFQIVQLEKTYPAPGDWETTSRVLADHPDSWVVLDGYQFDSSYQRNIKETGHRLLVIDDTAHLDHYYANILLNQNIHAEQLDYTCQPDTRLLLGTQYVLLRREFSPWRNWKREIPDVARKVLVTLGGGDPDNVTLKVIRALQLVDVDGLEAVVVAGASNQHYQELESAIHNAALDIRLVRNVSNMPELMAWADLAVSSGGSTCWELAFMQAPALLLVVMDHQWNVVNYLDSENVLCSLGWWGSVSDKEIAAQLENLAKSALQRAQMCVKSYHLVDGNGPERVLRGIADLMKER